MTQKSWSGEVRYRAILAVAEAANAHLELSALLDAVAVALEDLVPIDSICVIAREGEVPRAIGVHLGSNPRRSDEPEATYLERVIDEAERGQVTRGLRQMLDLLERERATVVVDDALKETRLAVARGSIRCMVLLPVTTRGTFVGALLFVRTTPRPFCPEEIGILEDIARPVGSAVANALAHDEIRRLRARQEEENLALKEEIAATTATGGIIGSSAALRGVVERVARVAATAATVLVTGETGTGKELIARAIHGSSPRAKRALIKVSCAALPEGLVASELFGHERGAFTGALERRRGRFELAAGGTIFLDEIGELPAPMQVALLRVLQEGEFERVGGHETLHTDARVVAATNRNLDDAVREGTFRSDLLFRLNVFPIRVPSLRERTEDIPVLVEYYASHYARKVGKRIRGVSASAMEVLTAYSWPGNVRELQNLVERAVILAHRDILGTADFELPRLTDATAVVADATETRRIEDALRAARGRVSGLDGAAEALGVPPSTLESRIRRLGIDEHAFRRRSAEPTCVR
jgi:transcriptional regulator with GAF, ATPase, and Fis domain